MTTAVMHIAEWKAYATEHGQVKLMLEMAPSFRRANIDATKQKAPEVSSEAFELVSGRIGQAVAFVSA